MKKFGFDLDNTIIDYSYSVLEYCKLMNIENVVSLSDLRFLLKKSENNQENWVKAQSWLYSDGLDYAKLSSGFIELCNILENFGYELAIFSHKTNLGPSQYGSRPFRKLATEWLMGSEINNFFTPSKNVNFYETIDEKVASISSYDPSFYIDDLPKIFKHPIYNRKIKSFLFKANSEDENWLIEINHFLEVKEYLF